ncbi:RNA polymerase sigma-70 factor [uncultured Draconibacterium sp.]|uniref:RNA polymerase sigma factor n=1 Tax=uncultured Draconibacterium sp. TaxID=1573823 RepID=UPI0029C72802|nr:RNA polymerase sigma-70 factor [uncultured Draconibacterium sp.]
MADFEQDIIIKLRSGDENSLRELFDLYYKPLCLFALKYVDSIEQAEDIVQDTFINFWNSRSYDNIHSNLKTYLFRAVRNNALYAIRKESKFRFEEIDNHVQSLVEDELPEDELKNLKELLFKQIEQLPPKGREIFKAIVFENMKYREVAELYGISVNTVKTQYSRSLSKLREFLDVLILLFLP